MSWAEILDCGDVPLTFLDNDVALKQLEKAHKVRNAGRVQRSMPTSASLRHNFKTATNCNTCLHVILAWPKVVSGRKAKAREKSLVPRIIALGGDHLYVLSDQVSLNE